MFFKKIVVLTILDISKPVFSSIVCIFMSTCLVAVLISLMISPVAGSIGSCPEIKIMSLASTAAEYGPKTGNLFEAIIFFFMIILNILRLFFVTISGTK